MITIDQILDISNSEQFESCALELFRFQAERCEPYRQYIELLGVNPSEVDSIYKIPFLPIELFKTQKVYCGENEPEVVFTSSNTGGTDASKHYMAEVEIYEKAFTKAFTLAYGSPSEVSIYGLLPSYLQREGSSLIYMVEHLIEKNKYAQGGFYLDDYDALLSDLKADKGSKVLLGVSYALWDLAERFPTALSDVVVMETGGMKGRREEISKAEFHSILTKAFAVDAVHSEYGMAELTSQAYSSGEGVFLPPPWMKITFRDLNNPFDIEGVTRGGINIIDLANIYSCAFIQTQDLGQRVGLEGFKIDGRVKNSEIRGCNLLVADRF